MNAQPIFKLPTSTNDVMSNNDRIEAALADLKSQEVLNYSTIVKKHGVVRTTLIRHFTGKMVSNYKADIEYQQALNIAQKKVLLGYIQRLWYTFNINVSQKLCKKDIWELP